MSWTVRYDQNANTLIHYGVKGMKWGVRRTPEQLGHKRVKRILEGKPLKYTSPGRELIKEIIKGTATSFIPGYNELYVARYLHTYGDFKNYDKGTETLKTLKKKPSVENTSESTMYDLKHTNKTGRKGYVKNCFNCVCAFEMRQRGYDVEARPRSQGATDEEYKTRFKGVKLNESKLTKEKGESRKKYVMRSYENLCKDLERNPEGARGFVNFSYSGTNSGHTVAWKIESGQAVFYDPQSGKKGADKELSLSSQDYRWGRLDNTKPLDSVCEIISSKGDKKKK